MGLRIIRGRQQSQQESERSRLLDLEACRYGDIKGSDPKASKEEFLTKINSIKARISIDSAKNQAHRIEEVLKKNSDTRSQGRLEPSLIIDLL